MGAKDNHTHKKYKEEDHVSFIRNSYAHKEIYSFPIYPISCGIHPWFIEKKDWKVQLDYLRKIAQDKKIVKIGECGLDKFVKTDIELQKQILVKQLELAQALNLPLIIHCVKRYEELFEIIRSFKELEYYIHGYNGKLHQTEQFLKHSERIKFGFGPRELSNKKHVNELLNIIPEERIGLETDSSPIGIKEVEKMFLNLKN